MQALIDFDGWRKWKDFSNKKQADAAAADGGDGAVSKKVARVKKLQARPSQTSSSDAP